MSVVVARLFAAMFTSTLSNSHDPRHHHRRPCHHVVTEFTAEQQRVMSWRDMEMGDKRVTGGQKRQCEARESHATLRYSRVTRAAARGARHRRGAVSGAGMFDESGTRYSRDKSGTSQ